MGKMTVHQLVLGMISTNVYLIQNKETGQIIIVDPADSCDRIVQAIEEVQGTPVAILLTHGHFDHIGAAEELKQRYQIPIYAAAEEREVLEDPAKNLSSMFAGAVTLTADRWVTDQEELELAGLKLIAYHTPGHTIGGVCYYFAEEHALFSGDTLFCESYGRIDFPTGSGQALAASVRRLLEEIPEDTIVYPGHESRTTIAHEKRYNPLAF